MLSSIARWGKALTKAGNVQRLRRVLSWALVVAMVTSLFPVQGLAVLADELDANPPAQGQGSADDLDGSDVPDVPDSPDDPVDSEEPVIVDDPVSTDGLDNPSSPDSLESPGASENSNALSGTASPKSTRSLQKQNPSLLQDPVPTPTVVAWDLSTDGQFVEGTNVYINGRTADIVISGDFTDDDVQALSDSCVNASYVDRNSTETNPAIQEATFSPTGTGWSYDAEQGTLCASFYFDQDGTYRSLQLVDANGIALELEGSTLTLASDVVFTVIVPGEAQFEGDLPTDVTRAASVSDTTTYAGYMWVQVTIDGEKVASITTQQATVFDDYTSNEDGYIGHAYDSETGATTFTINHKVDGEYLVEWGVWLSNDSGSFTAQKVGESHHEADVNAPKITAYAMVNGTKTQVEDGGFYPGVDTDDGVVRQIVVCVEDRHFDESQISVIVTPADDEAAYTVDGPQSVGEKHNCRVNAEGVWRESTDSDAHEYVITVDKDGQYTVDVKGLATEDPDSEEVTYGNPKDLLGNTASDFTTGTFSFDSDNPLLEVSFDNNEATNGKYYVAARTATIQVTDDNFDAAQTHVYVNGAEQAVTWSESQSCTVAFDQDGVYQLVVSGTGKSGRDLGYMDGDTWRVGFDSGEFVIDMTNPVVAVTYDNTISSGYYNAARTATIEITEENFYESAAVKATIAASVTIDKAAQGQAAPEATKWEYDAEKGVWVSEITFDADGEYSFTVTGKDLAGNEVGYKQNETTWVEDYTSETFVVDQTRPDVKTDYRKVDNEDTAVSDNHTGSLGDVLYYPDDQTITVVIKDRNLDLDNSSITYDGGEAIAVDGWDESDPDEDGIITFTATVPYSEGVHETPTVIASDLATNAGNQPVVEGFVIDKTAPDVDSVTLYAGDAETGPITTGSDAESDNSQVQFFNQDTTMAIVVSDNLGIEKAELTDDPDGQYVTLTEVPSATDASPSTTKTFEVALVDGADADKDAEFDRNVEFTVFDLAGNWRLWTIDAEGRIQAVNGGSIANVTINGENVYPYSLIKDTTAPIVTLSGVEKDAYYNGPQTIKASVDELNFSYLTRFDPERSVIQIEKIENTAASVEIGEPDTSDGALAKNFAYDEQADVWIYGVRIAEDGHYVVKSNPDFKDYATNAAVGAEIGSFTIDQTAPQVSVTWDNTNVKNTVDGVEYYDDVRTATITVFEHNFDESLISIDASGTRGNQAVSGEVGTWSHDGDTHTITVAYNKADHGSDGNYNLVVQGTDLAQNPIELKETNARDAMAGEGVIESGTFVIDTVDPVITTNYSDTAKSNEHENGVPVYNADKSIEITVTDRNLNRGSSSIVISNDGSASTVRLSSLTGTSGSGTNYTYTVSTANDGNVTYTFVYTYGENHAGKHTTPVVSVVDYANRTDSLSGTTFIIDETPPTISTTYEQIVSNNATGAFGSYPYFNQNQSITVTVKDRHLRLPDSALTDDANGNNINASQWTASQPDSDGVVTYTYTVSYDEGVHRSPVVSVEDYANHTASEAGHYFVIDKTAPEVSNVVVDRTPTATGVDGNTGNDPIQFFNQATTMTITLTDVYGLLSVTLDDLENQYVITNPINNAGQSSPITSRSITVALADGATNLQNDTEFERDITLTAVDIAGNWRTWTISRTGQIETKATGKISSANTSINNDSIYPYALVEDITNPTIALAGVTEGTYYNTPQTVTATINEFNFDYLQRFDGTRSIVRVTEYANAAGRAQSNSEVSAMMFTGSGSSWSYDRVFDTDGHYVVEAGFSDYANNPSNTTTIGEFTVDMTAPIITVEWDNNDVQNGKYYKATRTATITVTEHNFDASRFTITTTGTLASDWVTDGDTHTIVYFFDEAASHNLSVSGSDLAGNEAIEFVEPEFVVDLTAPKVSIAGSAQRTGDTDKNDAWDGELKNKSAYNASVEPEITFTDEQNFNDNGWSYTFVGNKLGDVTDQDGFTSHETSADEDAKNGVKDGVVVRYDDLGFKSNNNWDANVDDIYTITAQVVDLAGNEADAEIVFSVNRYGSNYIVEAESDDAELDLTEGNNALDAGMLDASPTITVTEINVSGAKSEMDHSVTKEFANDPTEIERDDNGSGEGYRLDEPSGKNAENDWGWAEYVYTIRSANFGEGSSSDTGDGGQGAYTVFVASDDAASNRNSSATHRESDSSSKAKHSTVSFMLDQVGPAIESLDLPDTVSVGEEYQASFVVKDDITDGDRVEVTVDGEQVDVTYDGSVITSDEVVGAGKYTFTIPASAFKGRNISIVVTDYAERVAEYASDGFYLSTMIAEGAIVLGVVAVAAGVIVYLRKKSSKKEEA